MDVTSFTPEARPDDRHRNVQVMKNNELRETMWELCYDLLPAAEREALIARIKSDPQAARLYAEVRLQADLVSAAARVEDDALILSPPAELSAEETPTRAVGHSAASAAGTKQVSPAPTARLRTRDAVSVPARQTSRITRQSLHWLLGTAALVLVGVMGYGLVRPLQSQHALADRYVITEIETPARMQSGLSSKVALKSSSVLGKSMEAQVDLKLIDPAGTVLFHEAVPTDEQGEASVELPGPAIRPGVRLEVAGRSRRLAQAAFDSTDESAPAANSVAVQLPVQSEPPLTYFWLEQPLGGSDEPVRYAAVNLDRFSLRPVAAAPRGSTLESTLGLGVQGEGSARDTRQLARAEPPLDDYLIEGTFDRRAAGSASDSHLDSLAMREQLERRAVTDNLPRSLKFRADDSLGIPPPPGVAAGSLVRGGANQAAPGEPQLPISANEPSTAPPESGKKQNDLDKVAAQAGGEPIPAIASLPAPAGPGTPPRGGGLGSGGVRSGGIGGVGRGSADLTAGGFGGGEQPAGAGGRADGLSHGTPAPDAATWAAGSAPEAAITDKKLDSLSLSGLPVVPAGEPVTVELSEELAGRKLLLQAINRDVVVATRALDESPAGTSRGSAEAKEFRQAKSGEVRGERTEARRYTLSLPPEADGEVEVEVLDLAQTPPQVIESYAYYRQPARELQIDFVSPGEAQTQFAPGDLVQMRLRVHNEQGAAAPAALGVRVWNEEAIQKTGEPVLLAEHVRRSQTFRATRPAAGEPLAQLEAKDSSRGIAPERVNSQQIEQQSRATTLLADAGNSPPPPAPPAPSPPEPTAPEAPRPAAVPADAPVALAPSVPAPAIPAPAIPAPSPVRPAAEKIAEASPFELAPEPTRPGELAGTPPAAVEQEMARTFADAELAATDPSAEVWTSLNRTYDLEPIRASNGLEVASEYQSQQSALEAQWQRWRMMAGRVLVVAGVLLLIGLALQLWIRMPTRVLGVTLAMTAAAASLVVGAMWVGKSPAGYEVALGSSTDGAAATSAPRAMSPAPTSPAPMSSAAFGPESAEVAGAEMDQPASEHEKLFSEVAPGNSAATGDAGANPSGSEPAGPPRPKAELPFGRDTSRPNSAAEGIDRSGAADQNSVEVESAAGDRPEGMLLRKSLGERSSGGPPSTRMIQPSASRGAVGDASPGGSPASPPRNDPAPLDSAEPARLLNSASQFGAAPATAAPADAKDADAAAGGKLTSEKLVEGETPPTAPASLYFNPRLATDEQGFVTITFQMPAVESDYRVLVDALGDGRIGSRELRIQCRTPAASATLPPAASATVPPAPEPPTAETPKAASPSAGGGTDR